VEFAYNESLHRSTGKSTFQIVYGMNPQGVSKLRYFEKNKFRSIESEDFAGEMQKLHDQNKKQLQKSSSEYKRRVDPHMRKLQFEVGDQVLAQLRKDRFLRGTYSKLKLKKIGPCKILRRFGENAYEIELPEDVVISPIFNIVDMYPYREDGAEGSED
jgi:hypothetical protein